MNGKFNNSARRKDDQHPWDKVANDVEDSLTFCLPSAVQSCVWAANSMTSIHSNANRSNSRSFTSPAHQNWKKQWIYLYSKADIIRLFYKQFGVGCTVRIVTPWILNGSIVLLTSVYCCKQQMPFCIHFYAQQTQTKRSDGKTCTQCCAQTYGRIRMEKRKRYSFSTKALVYQWMKEWKVSLAHKTLMS